MKETTTESKQCQPKNKRIKVNNDTKNLQEK